MKNFVVTVLHSNFYLEMTFVNSVNIALLLAIMQDFYQQGNPKSEMVPVELIRLLFIFPT